MNSDTNKILISDINRTIRDFVNESTIIKTELVSKKLNGYWDQFFVALDTVDDTATAIQSFQGVTTECFDSNPYTLTYGILQALFIQQDAVEFLKISLFGEVKKINWSKDYPELSDIRQLRNETIGHPVKKINKGGLTTSCTIDRSTLSKNGFNYILWSKSRFQNKSVNFENIINLQYKYLNIELTLILDELKKEEKHHKSKFKNESLSDLLNSDTLHQINLIYGVMWNDHLGWSSFNYYFGQYKKIREGLESRYGKFGISLRIPGTHEVIKKLDYIFTRLNSFQDTNNFDEIEFEIYVDSLDSELKELLGHLKEIDLEFKK